jgi:hypothetical protein
MLSAVDERPDSFEAPDQQPIGRVVGKRRAPPIGVMPDARSRAAMAANANYRTRAPKGIFFYGSHEEMARDRERWTLEAVLARQADRG